MSKYAIHSELARMGGNATFDRAAIEEWHRITGEKHPRARQAARQGDAGNYDDDGLLLVNFQSAWWSPAPTQENT